MPAGSISRRVARLEAAHGVTRDTVTLEREYIRADGTRYTIRHPANAADVADRAAEAGTKFYRRIEQLDGQAIDVAKASINDLLAAGAYTALVERVDTWHTRFGCDLRAQLERLADMLRHELAEGRIRDGE